jgi:hypothetical protein
MNWLKHGKPFILSLSSRQRIECLAVTQLDEKNIGIAARRE